LLIIVKYKDGKILYINAEPEDTTDDLKEKIAKHDDGVPPDVQRLIFEGRPLEDERTLSDYGIVNESTIHVLFRQRGC
jgi:Ubiquitin family